MKQKRPNVIVFLTDQQRWDTSRLCGNKMDITPNYDRLAMEGTHCYYGFTPQPVCLPARSCFQTGQYASRMNIFFNGNELPLTSVNLGQRFKDAGYTTGYIGKWHMCHQDPVPKKYRKGYDYWLGANILEKDTDAYHTELYDNDHHKIRLPGYRVDALTDVAIRYIAENRDKPFFLFVSYLEPHFQNTRDDYPAPYSYEERYNDPWTPPDLRTLGGTSPRHLPGYYGMVKRLDEALGRMQDALISLGIKDDTILAYTSDHGCHFKTRNSEYKRSCHDASVRIPMALNGACFSGGGRLREMVSLVDMAPTLLDACGIDVPDDMDGHSIVPLVNREDVQWDDYIYAEMSDHGSIEKSVRTKRWKYCVIADTKYSENNGFPKVYHEKILYDLKADPWELENLIGSKTHREVCDVLKEKLLKKLKSLGQKEIVINNAKEYVINQRELDAEEKYE